MSQRIAMAGRVNRNDETADAILIAAGRGLGAKSTPAQIRAAAAAVLRAAAADPRFDQRDYLTARPAEVLKHIADAVDAPHE
jgi:hypothetical protein